MYTHTHTHIGMAERKKRSTVKQIEKKMEIHNRFTSETFTPTSFVNHVCELLVSEQTRTDSCQPQSTSSVEAFRQIRSWRLLQFSCSSGGSVGDGGPLALSAALLARPLWLLSRHLTLPIQPVWKETSAPVQAWPQSQLQLRRTCRLG